VGEPPLMLAISVLSALTDAVASVADHKVFPDLDAPATPERILMAVEDVKRRAALLTLWSGSALAQLACQGASPSPWSPSWPPRARRRATPGPRWWSGPTGQAGTIGGGNLEHQVADQARRMLLSQVHFALQDYPLGPLLAQCCGGRVRLLIERLDKTAVDWLTDAARRLDADQPFEVRTRFNPGALSKTIAPGRGLQPRRRAITLAGEPATARGARPVLGDVLVEPQDLPRPPVLLFGAGHVGQAVARALEPLPFRLAWYDTRPETAGIPGVTSARRPSWPPPPWARGRTPIS
jgi:xanthine dehydrogenase accessory factor